MIPIVYLRTIKDPYLQSSLLSFATSITGCEINNGTNWVDGSELDIIFGSWKDRPDEHHVLKTEIVSKAKNFVVLETPLLGREKVELAFRDRYFRIGVNGFLAHNGTFDLPIVRTSRRWDMLQRDLNIRLEQNSQKENGPIIIALQLPGDASLLGTDISKWAADTVDEIRLTTNRNIIIRSPQLPRQYDNYHMKRIAKHVNVEWQEGTKQNLKETLQSAFCAVTFSSGLGLDALMYGCPVIACSPASFAYDLCPNDVSDIENVTLPYRHELFNKLAYYQWSFDELADGTAWDHILHILNNAENNS